MLHIHSIRTRYPHWGKYSGIHQFVKHLDPQEYSVDMWVALDNDEDFFIKNKLLRGWLRYEVQKQGMQWYKLSDLVAEFKAWQKCWQQPVDIIHYLDGEHTAQFLPKLCKLSFRRRPKLIATYHQPPELIDTLLNKQVLPMLDLVTVVSPEQASYFSKFIEPDKVRSILHGIDVDYFQPALSMPEDEKFRCITVGKYLRDFKALRNVAELLVSYCNIEFHVVSSDASELQNLPNIRVYQGLDDASLLKLYQQSNVLFLPLTQSTANNALLEGMACGLPVVSTLLPSVQAYLPGQEATLIKDNDPRQFVETILHLANNHQLRRDMGQAARKRAQDLNWRSIASEYEKLYSDLMGVY